MMEVERTSIEGLLLLRPHKFADERGSFMETWNEGQFRELVGPYHFVQDNESTSKAGVLRGLHLQLAPNAQGKLLRAVRGAVLDVCVDVRKDSPTYGRHFKVRLDAVEPCALWIPPGFAHGFLALEDNTVFAYKCTAPYDPKAERTILWNDPDLGIEWGIDEPLISDKDRNGSSFAGDWHMPNT